MKLEDFYSEIIRQTRARNLLEIKSGDHLPPERKYAENLEVSRNQSNLSS